MSKCFRTRCSQDPTTQLGSRSHFTTAATQRIRSLLSPRSSIGRASGPAGGDGKTLRKPSSGSADRRFFDKMCLDDKASFISQRDGARFLAAVLQYDDHMDLLFRLMGPKDSGLKRLKIALSMHASETGINTYLVPLLQLLGSDTLTGTSCRRPLHQLLEEIYRVPGLMSCIHDALAARSVADAAPLGWFLLALACKLEEARQDPMVLAVAEQLLRCEGGAKKAGEELRVVLAGSEAAAAAAESGASSTLKLVSLEDLQTAPGGRHDNDSIDYRSIKIIPTPDEALCTRQPFLPRFDEVQHLGSPEAAVLDRQFRLLREDMMQPLRQALSSLCIIPPAQPAAPQPEPAAPPAAASSATEATADLAAAIPKPKQSIVDSIFGMMFGSKQQQAPPAAASSAAPPAGAASTGAEPSILTHQSSQPAGRQERQPISAQLQRNVFPVVGVLGVAQKPRPCIMLALLLPDSHQAAGMQDQKEREEFWTEFGRSTLPLDALVCLALVRQGDSDGNKAQPRPFLLFGTVTRRDPKEMSAATPILGLSFNRGQETSSLLQLMGAGALKGLVLVEVSTSFFTYQPLLSCLQSMSTVPLAEEIVHGKPPSDAPCLTPEQIQKELDTTGQTLDPSQKEALRHALLTRVALIQGPPGTGKTFVGALVADALVRLTQETVLVVCYTNHALDQFLEVLEDKGITDIVRIGGKSKSRRMDKYSLFQRQQNSGAWVPDNEYWRLRAMRNEEDKCKQQMSGLEELLVFFSSQCRRSSSTSLWNQVQGGSRGSKEQQKQQQQQSETDAQGSSPQTPPPPPLQVPSAVAVLTGPVKEQRVEMDLWKVLGPFLKQQFDEAWEQLQPRPGLDARIRASAIWRMWLSGYSRPGVAVEEQVSGVWTKAPSRQWMKGTQAYPVAQNTLLHEANAAAGPLRLSAEDGDVELGDIWQLPYVGRMHLAIHWMTSLKASWCNELQSSMARCKEIQDEIRALNDATTTLATLKAARVIGCTTTGAAKYKDLLQNPELAPTIVMVEEAGELQESHTLTSLSPKVKQLIMIGDHKQLRPKVKCYSLSVESGGGHDLNVSMFERLALSGFPHVTLGVQHRMHPDISRIVRGCTYPKLQDHPRVMEHPPVLGLEPGRRVVFIDHEEQEEQEQGQGWGNKSFQSKVNVHEVQMAVSMVRYMLQQGYRPDQVVVLTPYLGQLQELCKAIRASDESMQVSLTDLDINELRNTVQPQALMELPTRAASDRSILVATIDNYQGEEADVIIASLVRSNDRGSVGFLKEPERINVLFSRAKHGLLLIGNASTLRNASNSAARGHWRKVLGLVEEKGGLLQGLPAQCQLHNTRTLLSKPGAFLEQAPHGGCCKPCETLMPCGHTCTLRCHAWDREHKGIACKELIHEFCTEGHLITRMCHMRGQSCDTCVDLQRIKDEERLALRKLEADAAAKRSEAEKEQARLVARIEQMRQQQAFLQEAQEARKQSVRLELEQKLVEKELSLQKKQAEVEMADWEKEQRRKANADIQEMEKAAKLEAVQAAKKALEAEKLSEELAATAKQLERLESETGRKLQDIENRKTQAMTQAEDGLRQLSSTADESTSTYISAAQWMDKIGDAATGAAGLASFRQLLLSSSMPTDALDVLLRCPGVGQRLQQYAGTSPAQGAGPNQGISHASGSTPVGSLSRGMALIKDGQWLDALSYFSGQAGAKGSQVQGGGDAAAALLELCRAELALDTVDAPPQPTRGKKQRRALVQVPMSSPPAPEEEEEGELVEHPALHLASAVNCKRQAGAARDHAKARELNAKAVAAALSFLLHPVTSHLPSSLRDKASDILSSSHALLGDFKAMAASVAPGGSGSSPLALQQKAAWEARATSSLAFKKTLELIGLAPVKQALSDLADQVDLDKERKRALNEKQYNACFYGNPGTGKTTIARLYAELLKELTILPGSQVIETSGAKLLNGGVNELKKHLQALDSGGVLFVDEAYQLNPKSNPQGAQVLDALLPEMENRRGKLVVVFAGYQKQMEGLMSHNEGLPSRFPLTFTFPDYSDSELHAILQGIMASDPRFKLEDAKHGRIACARLGRQRGTVGFGNARAVRNFYERVQERQAARVLKERAQGLQPDVWQLTRHDVLGPKVLDVSSSSALAELAAMRGLPKVKEQVNNMLSLIRTNAELEEQGRPLKELCLNRVLVGNPGTGKTTVAGIYGRILKDLGLLSKGDVIVRSPSDFTGAVLGESEQKTVAILEAAVGSVLVIDEAYGLFSGSGTKDPYKEAIIDTIVAKVQGVPGDDRCVLLLGYEEQMEAMMRQANPGLQRRFQWQDRWHFQDYSPEDLLHIMRGAAKKRYGWDLDEAPLLAGVKALEGERRRPNFGNAGAVNNLLSLVAQRMELRLKALPAAQRAQAQPTPEDFLPARKPSGGIFDDLVGCSSILRKLREWQAVIEQCKKMGKDPLASIELNFRFVGNPGTGKTTVARRVGTLFESLGLLSTGEVLNCSASDFVTGFANQSGGKTRELFNKAVGGVLFIDEAYRLNPEVGGPMMSEVLDEIVTLLTEERFKGKMVVILAGYEAQIEQLMKVNPGLKSRFSQRLVFPDFCCEDACMLFRQQLRNEFDLTLSTAADAALPGFMRQLITAPGWANGRDIGTWVKGTFSAFAQRSCAVPEQVALTGEQGATAQAVRGGEDPAGVSLPDLTASLTEMLSGKAEAALTPGGSLLSPDGMPMEQLWHFAPSPAPVQTNAAVARAVEASMEAAPPQPENEELEAAADPAQELQDSVGTRVLAALEEACAELKYGLDQVAAMLRPGGEYSPELLALVMRKSGCANQGEVVAALDAQKPAFLAKVELLIRTRQKEKTEQEVKVQQQLHVMGRCPMNFAWLKVSGGWRCAGGSHYVSDAALSP